MDDEKLVLVVDDEPAIVDFMQLLLEEEGYRTMRADSGPAALHAVARNRPDMIVLDVRMPHMSGWDVLEHLQQAGHTDIPVIVMSADFTVSKNAAEQAIYAFIDKPFMPDKLLALINEHCSSH